MRILVAPCLVLVALSLACQRSSDETPVERGKRTYVANCLACHNADPAQDGTLGPAIAGSSLALVEARVMRAEYPPGYTPKRPSSLMPPQPYLQAQIPDLAAYLQSIEPN